MTVPIFGFTKFGLKLAPQYNTTVTLVYLFGVLFTISFFVFINSTQSFVLKEILRIPTEELGNATGSLVFYDELLSVIVIAIWGIISDHIGRYFVFGSGMALMAAALYSFTFATNLYPQLLLLRLLFALGAAAASSMLTAILADLTIEEDRGKFSGLVGLISGVGALVGVFVFLRLPPSMGLRTSYLLVGTISIAMGVCFFFSWISLKRERWAVDDNSDSGELEAQQPTPLIIKVFNSAKSGFLAAQDAKVLLGYVSSFLARSDSVSITVFIPLWVYKYYLENNLCSIPGGLESPDINEVCRSAYLRASVMSGVTQVFALVGAPIFGYLNDLLYRPLTVLIASLMAGLGYFLLSLSNNPQSAINFLYLALIGFGEIGLIVTSLSLVTNSSVPKAIRGSVAGIASFFGAVGIMICTKVGGMLFDTWWSGGPFFLLGILHLAFLIFGVVIFLSEMRRNGGYNYESYQKMKNSFKNIRLD